MFVITFITFTLEKRKEKKKKEKKSILFKSFEEMGNKQCKIPEVNVCFLPIAG